MAVADPEFEALLSRAQSAVHAGRYAECEELAERAIARAKASGAVGLEMRATRTAACAMSLAGKYDQALSRLAPVLELFRAHPRSPELDDPLVGGAVFWAHLDWVTFAGFHATVSIAARLEVLDRVEAGLVARDEPRRRPALLNTRAMVVQSQGRLAEAAALYRESIVHFQPDQGYTLASCRQQFADLLVNMKEYESAEAQYLAIVHDDGAAPRDKKSAHVGLARLAVRRGATAQAIEHAEAAVTMAKALGDDAAINALIVLVEARCAQGSFAHAEAVADQLLERARRTGRPRRLYYALRTRADVALARSDREGARASLDEAAALAEVLDRASAGDAFRRHIEWRRAKLG